MRDQRHTHFSPQRATPVAGLTFLLLSCTVLQRFGVNAGNISLSIALLAMYTVVMLALLSGRIEVSADRLAAYSLGAAAALASALANRNFMAVGDGTSLASLALLLAIHLPLVMRIDCAATNSTRLPLDCFANIAFLCALTGIAQFYAQFLFHADWLFDYSRYIPQVLRATGEYNTEIAAGAQHKANGFFFREPSGYSYIMALGLIVEWLHQQRTARLICLALALLLSYSGTGLLTLMIALLFPLGARTLLRFALLGSVAVAGYWLFGDLLNLSFTLERTAEFSSQASSAHLRYVAPWRFIGENIESTPWSFWLGHGPGSISRASQLAYAFHDPTWAKLLYEYGVFGFSAFVLLTLTVLWRSAVPLPIRAVIFCHWLIMGGYLLKPECVAVTFAFFCLYPARGLDTVRSRSAHRSPGSAGGFHTCSSRTSP